MDPASGGQSRKAGLGGRGNEPETQDGNLQPQARAEAGHWAPGAGTSPA